MCNQQKSTISVSPKPFIRLRLNKGLTIALVILHNWRTGDQSEHASSQLSFGLTNFPWLQNELETGTRSNVSQAQQLDRSDSARVPYNLIGNIVTLADIFWILWRLMSNLVIPINYRCQVLICRLDCLEMVVSPQLRALFTRKR